MRAKLRNWLALGLGVVTVGYGGAAGYMYGQQTRLIYPGAFGALAPVVLPDPQQVAWRPVEVVAEDGVKLRGVVFPSARPGTTLVLAFGGNAQDVVGLATFLRTQVWSEDEVAVAGVAYRGYAQAAGAPSEGVPDQAALLADAQAVLRHMQTDLQPARTLLVGYSLGSGVATGLAVAEPSRVQGLALLAPPSSIRRMAEEAYPWLPVRLLLRSPWPTEDWLRQVQVPVLVAYSPDDGLIPARHVEILRHVAPGARFAEIAGTTHGTLASSPGVVAPLRQLLHENMPTPTPAPFAPGRPGARTPVI